MQKNRGVTLVENLILLTIIVIVVAIICGDSYYDQKIEQAPVSPTETVETVETTVGNHSVLKFSFQMDPVRIPAVLDRFEKAHGLRVVHWEPIWVGDNKLHLGGIFIDHEPKPNQKLPAEKLRQ